MRCSIDRGLPRSMPRPCAARKALTPQQRPRPTIPTSFMSHLPEDCPAQAPMFPGNAEVLRSAAVPGCCRRNRSAPSGNSDGVTGTAGMVQVTCSGCGEVGRVAEQYRDLSLELPPDGDPPGDPRIGAQQLLQHHLQAPPPPPPSFPLTHWSTSKDNAPGGVLWGWPPGSMFGRDVSLAVPTSSSKALCMPASGQPETAQLRRVVLEAICAEEAAPGLCGPEHRRACKARIHACMNNCGKETGRGSPAVRVRFVGNKPRVLGV